MNGHAGDRPVFLVEGDERIVTTTISIQRSGRHYETSIQTPVIPAIHAACGSEIEQVKSTADHTHRCTFCSQPFKLIRVIR